MSNLGLDQLTDDQLLDLLTEACAELGQRDPLIRNLAQKAIYAEAERVKVFKTSIEAAVAAAKADYEKAVRKEARKLVDDSVKRGKWSPMGANEEVCLAVAAEVERRKELISEAEKALGSTEQKLWLSISATSINASYMYQGLTRRTTNSNRLNPEKVETLLRALKMTLEV